MSKKNHPPPYFELNPATIFSDTAGMDSKAEKWDYMVKTMRAWVDMDIDSMPYWMLENLGRVRDVSEVRARAALMRWKPAETDAIGMQMHANALQVDAIGMQPSLLLSSLKESKKKKTIVYALDGTQYEIAVNMDSLQKEAYGDDWRSRTPSQLQSWAGDIDKMHRIDKVPYSMIWGWYCACYNDDFWKTNVQSPNTLRKHVANNKLTKLIEKAKQYAHHPYDEVYDES